jgi:Fe-S-cluster containining protein
MDEPPRVIDPRGPASEPGPSVALDHPRFRSVWAEVFTRRFVADCMAHRCMMIETHTEKLDACCQYGCDVDLRERAAIEAHGDEIRELLRDEVKDARWFDPEEHIDDDYPSGRAVRTEVHEGGCIFLAHDRRGCAIHRAALEGGWDVRGVKPAICRLFPLSYEADAIVIADEFAEYSCSHVAGPSLYRMTRDTLADIFGELLVVALDAAEAQVLAAEAEVPTAAPRRLPVAR